MRDFGELLRRWPRLARFVTEFGAQAAPIDAPWLEPERWPHLDWDAAYRHYALQRVFFDRHVPPADHPDYASWAEATQRYQADLVRYHIETLRRLRYRPTGGFAMFCFADSAPGVTWSVLDHERRPKLGYHALARACAPVLVVATWPPEVVRPGDTLALDLHVINDTRDPLDELVLRARLSWGDNTDTHHHSWSWAGAVGADDLAFIATLVARVPEVSGPLELVLELDGAGGVEPARYSITVTPE
jgi:beta-mannosidase